MRRLSMVLAMLSVSCRHPPATPVEATEVEARPVEATEVERPGQDVRAPEPRATPTAPKAGADPVAHRKILELASECLSEDDQPLEGVLEGVIGQGKLTALKWRGEPAPKVIDACVRRQLKTVKLPEDDAFAVQVDPD